MTADQASRKGLIRRVSDPDADDSYRRDAARRLVTGYGYRTIEQVVAVIWPLKDPGVREHDFETFDILVDVLHEVELDAFKAAETRTQERQEAGK